MPRANHNKTSHMHARFLNEDERAEVEQHEAAIAQHNEAIKHHTKARRMLTNRALNRARTEGMKLVIGDIPVVETEAGDDGDISLAAD